MGTSQLKALGYQMSSRTNSLEALELFKKKPASFDIFIIDMTMPEMTGDELAREIKRIRPGIPIILCTGEIAGYTFTVARLRPMVRKMFKHSA
jgi:CheY-like chemotaxis protein